MRAIRGIATACGAAHSQHPDKECPARGGSAAPAANLCFHRTSIVSPLPLKAVGLPCVEDNRSEIPTHLGGMKSYRRKTTVPKEFDLSRASGAGADLLRSARAAAWLVAARLDEPGLVGEYDGLRTVVESKLGEDAGDVRFDGSVADDEFAGDFGV
jgi:hypothetical protein